MDMERWYRNIPVVTRTYLTLACLTSGAVTFEFLTPLNLYLNYKLTFEKMEVWRLLTNFLYFDRINVNLFFHMMFLYSYCRRLEEHYYHRRTGDFLFMLFLGAVAMLLISAFVYDIVFLSHSLVLMVVYVWSRRNPDEHLNLLGFCTVSAPFLPYVMMGFSYLLAGGSAAAIDAIGMVVGHLYWFLADIAPRILKFELIRTPAIISALFPQDEVHIQEDMEHEE